MYFSTPLEAHLPIIFLIYISDPLSTSPQSSLFIIQHS